MKINVKTRIKSFYNIPVIGKILIGLRRKMPVVEGYEALLHVEYTEEDSKELPILSIKPVLVEPRGVGDSINRWGYEPWMTVNDLSLKFYPSVSGYVEWRIYFKDLKDSDEIIDDYGRVQPLRGNIGSDKDIRYYYKAFRVYSLHEVLMIVFAGAVTIFTVLLFIITIISLFN